MQTIKVQLPGVQMTGSPDQRDGRIEVGQHGFALFLTPDADYPVLDINGTPEQLGELVTGLQAALASQGEKKI